MRGGRPRTTERSRALRQGQTDAEKLLWRNLRDRQLAGCKFKRQLPIGSYFADFACAEKRLIVELDGGQHVEQVSYDDHRTRFLQSQGYRVLRFWNDQALKETSAVLEEILRVLSERWPQKSAPHPSPLPVDEADGERGNSKGKG